MAPLSSSLVKHRVASIVEVERALARQVLYGGDLVTNLLELATVDEAELVRLLADSYGLPACAAGALPKASEGARRLVPAELVARHGFYPLEEAEGLLRLAVSQPLSPEVLEDVEFALGIRSEQRVTTLPRIQQALARDYGLALDGRIAAILGKLDGFVTQGSVTPPGPAAVDRRRPSASQIKAAEAPPDSRYAPLRPGSWRHLRAVDPRESRGDSARYAPLTPELVDAPPHSLRGPDSAAPTPRIRVVIPAVAGPEPMEEPSSRPESAEAAVALLADSAPRAAAASAPPAAAGPATPARDSETSAAESERGPITVRSDPPPGVAPNPEPPSRGSGRPRRLGPYTPAMAKQDLLEASSTEAIVATFFDFAAQYFVYAALFALQSEHAEGRHAAGPGASPAEVCALRVPLDQSSSLRAVRDSRSWQLSNLTGTALDRALCRDLARPSPRQLVLWLPVVVRGRVVLVLYGDHGDVDVELSRVGEVLAFVPLVAQAFERLIVLRKKKERDRPSLPPPPSRLPASRPLPSAGERAKALVEALAVTAEPSGAISGGPLPGPEPKPPEEDRPVSATSRGTQISPMLIAGAEPRVGTPPMGQGSAPATPAFPLTRLSSPPRRDEIPNDEDWDRATPVTHGGPLGRAEPDHAIASPSERPSDVDAPSFGSDYPPPLSVREVPLAAASRSESFAPQRPRPRQSPRERELPTVIVNFEGDYQPVIERILTGDEQAIRDVVALGEPIVSMLVARFPGPTTPEPIRSLGEQPTRASACGPLLRALALLGAPAAPFVIVRTADADPKVRSWATRLLGELQTAEAVQAVVRRVGDEDPEVRRSAIAAARMLQAHPKLEPLLRDGLLRVAAESEHGQSRYAAIEALAEIRDGSVVPDLIMMLQDPSDEIVRSAHWALGELTRQDFGSDTTRWGDWWRQSAGRHRIEWLIESLMHDSVEIRRAASEELKALSKEYFGYYEDLPPRERLRAQERYREWWHTKGRARFS